MLQKNILLPVVFTERSVKYLFWLALLLPLLAGAQDPKGVQPLETPALRPSPSVTRAVVVGISDYQDPAIPDLHYADADARAFAEWLQSPGGGQLPPDRLKLLLNQQATRAQVYAALDWLLEESAEGDRAIIYFSGHGDVETKYRNQPGFLLCWDSPPKSYIAGALQVSDLANVIIPTLSIDKKAHVLLITDACRAGKLAGSAVNGASATATALSAQFANETKILSCQPNEVSHEGAQWGGGRGVFSYYLVEGLTGLADKGDLMVTLSEIDRYLEDHVTPEVAPASQLPFTVGNKAEVLAQVDAAQLAALVKQKAEEGAHFSGIEGRLAAAGLTPADSALYAAFEQALREKRFFEPANACADTFFQQLIRNKNLIFLHNTMRRSYAAALQDEVQQALNALLADDPYESNNWRYNPARYAQFPAYLERAIELLGEGHYMRNALLSKKLYFDAYLLTRNLMDREPDPLRRDSVRNMAIGLLQEAVRLEDRAPYLYHALAALYTNNDPERTDSVLAYDQRAIDLAPTWLSPYLDIVMEYQHAQNDYVKGEPYLLKAYDLNPKSYLMLERMAWLRQWQGRLDEAIDLCHQMMALKPDLFNAYGTLSHTYWIKGEPLKTREWALKLQALNPANTYNPADIVYSYFSSRQPDEAMKIARPIFQSGQLDDGYLETLTYAAWYLKEAEQYDEALKLIRLAEPLHIHPTAFVLAKVTKGIIQYEQGQKADAEQTLRLALTLDPFRNPFYAIAWSWLGVIEAGKGRNAEAETDFRTAIAAFSGNRMDDFQAMEEAHYQYGRFLLVRGRLGEAEEQFKKANDWRFQNGYKGWYGLACVAARKGHNVAALDLLEKALDCFYPLKSTILEEPFFIKIRKTKRFKALMAKHFPPGWEAR